VAQNAPGCHASAGLRSLVPDDRRQADAAARATKGAGAAAEDGALARGSAAPAVGATGAGGSSAGGSGRGGGESIAE